MSVCEGGGRMWTGPSFELSSAALTNRTCFVSYSIVVVCKYLHKSASSSGLVAYYHTTLNAPVLI